MTLPPLNFLGARSTYAAAATGILLIASLFGIDLLSFLCAVKIACTSEQMAEGIQEFVAFVTFVWAYLERKNPSRSISFTGGPTK